MCILHLKQKYWFYRYNTLLGTDRIYITYIYYVYVCSRVLTIKPVSVVYILSIFPDQVVVSVVYLIMPSKPYLSLSTINTICNSRYKSYTDTHFPSFSRKLNKQDKMLQTTPKHGFLQLKYVYELGKYILEKKTLESNGHTHKIKNTIRVKFSRPNQWRSNVLKAFEVRGDVLWPRHTALMTAVIKINRFLKEWPFREINILTKLKTPGPCCSKHR